MDLPALPPQARYLLAVSGGCDSMCLLHQMACRFPASQLVVAHFHHRLRGTSADADEALVRAEAARLGLTFVGGHAVAGLRSEGALREARLRFLRRARRRAGAHFIVTAHHADDQLETFLMRLLRGAGLDGLCSMRARRGVFLKPLLGVSRAQLRRYAELHAIVFREDESNRDTRYLRNRLRHEALPSLLALADAFGGRDPFLTRFQATVEELHGASSRLRAMAAARWKRYGVETPLWFRLPLGAWENWSWPSRQRVLREVLRRLGAPTPSRSRLQQAVRAMSERVGRHEVPGVRITFSCEQFFFQTPAQRSRARSLPPIERAPQAFSCPELGLRCALRAPELLGLEARFFRPGDRFRGTKLKHLFLARRIPSLERPFLVVLARPGTGQVEWYFHQLNHNVNVESIRFPFSSPSPA